MAKDSSDDSAIRYVPGDIVPWHFIPSIIVASFFASLCGALLTIELLQRKRLGRSLISRCVQRISLVRYIADSRAESTFSLAQSVWA
jgi:hypothetical protein